jgi:hypothetical protein
MPKDLRKKIHHVAFRYFRRRAPPRKSTALCQNITPPFGSSKPMFTDIQSDANKL